MIGGALCRTHLLRSEAARQCRAPLDDARLRNKTCSVATLARCRPLLNFYKTDAFPAFTVVARQFRAPSPQEYVPGGAVAFFEAAAFL
jgi:hypothetical protein